LVLATGKSVVVELNEKDLQDWRAIMRPVWDQFADDIGDDVMRATAAGKAH
jgi:C4-dicarboxylate-binding protein DctP